MALPSRRSAVVLAALLLLAVGAPADAAPSAANERSLERSVRYLQAVQNADGGFGGTAGQASDPLFTSWAAYALAAFAVNPLDQAKPGGSDVHTYLTRHTDALRATTDFERTALVAHAACTDPRAFGGVDLIAPILARQRPDGSISQAAGGDTGFVNATIFGILALAPLGDEDRAIAAAADWVQDTQHARGSFPGFDPQSPNADLDMTGAALEALAAAGRPTGAAARRTLAFLRDAQNPDGGWGAATGSESNAASTAWVVQGLVAVGEDPDTWVRDGETPYRFLAGLQQDDGSIRWMRSRDANRVWMTAQTAPAFAGRAYPLACVPRSTQPPEPPPGDDGAPADPQPSGVGGDGQGGTGTQEGDGVIAGGGGAGAPVFSGPQPQSQGAARGGARDTRRRSSAERRRERAAARRRARTGRAPAPAAAAPGATTAPAAPVPGAPAAPGAAAPAASGAAPATPAPGAAATPVPPAGGDAQPGADGTGAAGAPVAGIPTAVPGQPGGAAITGTLIGQDAPGAAGAAEAAPGLQASKAGDPVSPAPALVLAGLLAACALGGWRHEATP